MSAPAQPSPWDVEHLLRTRASRWGLVACLVVLVSAATSAQRYEIFGAFGREPDVGLLFARQLLFWSAWAVAGSLAVRLARWMLERLRSWLFVLALQLPLSLAVAWAFARFYGYLLELFGEGPRSFRPPPEMRFPTEMRPPGRPPSFSSFRIEREFLVYWVVLGVGAAVHMLLRSREHERRAAALELRQARLEAELARTQVDSLKSQLHPHFLFNALHSVGGLVRSGQDADALRTLSSLGELLRHTLDQGDAQELELSDELAIAERYLAIERIRFGERLRTCVAVAPDVRGARVPALVLLPLVENAVRYGVAPREEGGRVEIRAAREGERLVLEVCDDGPGFPASIVGGEDRDNGDARRGIGLENTRERLRMLYGSEQSFELSNAPEGGARVRLRLPLALFEDEARG